MLVLFIILTYPSNFLPRRNWKRELTSTSTRR